MLGTDRGKFTTLWRRLVKWRKAAAFEVTKCQLVCRRCRSYRRCRRRSRRSCSLSVRSPAAQLPCAVGCCRQQKNRKEYRMESLGNLFAP
ncbi:uncharacterized protein Dsimw501_GD28349, isoform D [Drosophila simulans]|nr:uncharacterized protein Dsimw501_GD28349, isoform D [Drosophila simulans]